MDACPNSFRFFFVSSTFCLSPKNSIYWSTTSTIWFLLISNVDSQSRCTIVGKSLDDSAGEVFDKVARKMGLKYPGGPEISRMADKISKSTFKFTRPMINSNSFDMSFSGLKTNVVREINKLDLNEDVISDIAYDFQECVIDILIKKTIAAARFYTQDTIAISGGVSANKKLRDRFKKESFFNEWCL